MEALRNLFMDLYARLLRFLNLFKTSLKEHDHFYIPIEIVTDEIISRLPVKSILQLRSVSKPWLSRISHPSFINLQLTHATTALFIPARDLDGKLLIFLGSYHGGSLTRLMTLGNIRYDMVTKTQHLNGLVLLTVEYTRLKYYEAIVVNPSTRKTLKLFSMAYKTSEHVKYFFGFDETTNQHKILRMCGDDNDHSTLTLEIIVLSSSNYLWKKIDATTFDIGKNFLFADVGSSICVDSVIHIMLPQTVEILAFDLRTDTFFSIKVPINERHYDLIKWYGSNAPYLLKINGCIGVVICHCVLNTDKIDIWILQDYENRIWVKETVILPWPYGATRPSIPFDSLSTGEIIFSVRKGANVISVPVYSMKTRRFRSIEFTDLDHLFQFLPSICFYQIKCYLESIMPLLVT